MFSKRLRNIHKVCTEESLLRSVIYFDIIPEIVQEIAMCVLQYKNNLCEANPVPAMVQQCAKWEACMNRDPAVIGRAKVSAELIAEVVNSFVEPISWKTLVRANRSRKSTHGTD